MVSRSPTVGIVNLPNVAVLLSLASLLDYQFPGNVNTAIYVVSSAVKQLKSLTKPEQNRLAEDIMRVTRARPLRLFSSNRKICSFGHRTAKLIIKHFATSGGIVAVKFSASAATARIMNESLSLLYSAMTVGRRSGRDRGDPN